MIFPLGVEYLEHNLALHFAHLWTDIGVACLIILLHQFNNLSAEGLFVETTVFFQPLTYRQLQGEIGVQGFFQPLDIPLLFETLGRNKHIHGLSDHVFANRGNHVGDITIFKQIVALLIDHLTLIVGHIIVFQQVLTNIKVAPFDFALGFDDGIGDHAVFYRFAVLHTH